MLVSVRLVRGRPFLSSSSTLSLPSPNREYYRNTFERLKARFQYAFLIIAYVSIAVLPALQQNLIAYRSSKYVSMTSDKIARTKKMYFYGTMVRIPMKFVTDVEEG